MVVGGAGIWRQGEMKAQQSGGIRTKLSSLGVKKQELSLRIQIVTLDLTP